MVRKTFGSIRKWRGGSVESTAGISLASTSQRIQISVTFIYDKAPAGHEMDQMSIQLVNIVTIAPNTAFAYDTTKVLRFWE